MNTKLVEWVIVFAYAAAAVLTFSVLGVLAYFVGRLARLLFQWL